MELLFPYPENTLENESVKARVVTKRGRRIPNFPGPPFSCTLWRPRNGRTTVLQGAAYLVIFAPFVLAVGRAVDGPRRVGAVPAGGPAADSLVQEDRTK
jgi:hypothetical protein